MKSKTLQLTSLLATISLIVVVAATLATRGTKASPDTTLYVSHHPTCNNHAPCDHNVQDALETATTGDEIRVASGVYTYLGGTVAEITKTITLQGGWNPDFTDRDPDLYPTTLDAQGNGRVIYIHPGFFLVYPTIEGFIITGGNATDEVAAPGKGGGIYCDSDGPIIVNNVITNNVAYMGTTGYGWGGGIYLNWPPPSTVISGNTIISNAGSTTDCGVGGGLYVESGDDPQIIGNEIVNNTAPDYGGGIYLSHSNATLSDNKIIHNTASHTVDHMPYGIGGGLYIEYTSPFTLTNNIIAQNHSQTCGGGIYVLGDEENKINSTGELVNNSFSQNNLGNGKEAVYLSYYSALTLTNNIIVTHTYGIYAVSSGTATADYTLFFGNTNDTGGPGTIISTNEVTGTDPLFVSPSAWDYHIRRLSPAIDAGDPASTEPTTDFEGDPRPIDGDKDTVPRFDIGADEFNLLNDLFLPLIMKNY